jgi:serine/threonine protein kinase
MNVRPANSGLINTLRGLDLLAPEQFTQLLEEVARRELSGRELGQFLLQRRWLTAFQVNHFLQGKGQHLLLGPYVLIERLGSGGMGEVFKARHRRLHRLSAVKVLSRAQLDNPTARERFLREAEAAAQLSHPNIVAVHDAGFEGERPYLAMEFIDGLDLGRLLQQSGPLPTVLACEFTRQAALGLHHAHECGYVHRDIKPQNLLVAPQGGMKRAEGFRGLAGACVKVLDMGLVRHQRACTEETELALTQHGVVIGTIDYVAPEQASNAHHVDRRADLYSLGCTLYHLLAGQPPFAGGHALDKLLRHRSEAAPPLLERRPDVPVVLSGIVARLMAKDPNDRYPTALELIHDLANLASGKHAVPVVIEAPTDDLRVWAELEPTRAIGIDDLPSALKSRPRRWWPLIAGGVAAVLVLALGIRALTGRPAVKVPPPKKRVEKPPDTALVVGVNPQAVLTAPILRPPA